MYSLFVSKHGYNLKLPDIVGTFNIANNTGVLYNRKDREATRTVALKRSRLFYSKAHPQSAMTRMILDLKISIVFLQSSQSHRLVF